MWIYCGQLEVCPYLIYEYTRTKEGRHARQFLQGFRGYLQADAASTFDQLYVDELIWEVGCAAHMRRYFYNARHEDSKRAYIALAYFRRLYKLERELKEYPSDVRRARRRADALPILAALKRQLDQWAGHVLPASQFGKAVQYASNHWEALLRYCDEGWLIIDNTRSERALRTIAGSGWQRNTRQDSSKVLDVDFLLPVRLNQDAVDQVNVHRATAGCAHRLQHRGQTEIAALPQNAVGRANDQLRRALGESAVGQPHPLQLAMDELAHVVWMQPLGDDRIGHATFEILIDGQIKVAEQLGLADQDQIVILRKILEQQAQFAKIVHLH
jgi:hypothetical protein